MHMKKFYMFCEMLVPNDLHHQYSHTFMKSISCLCLPTIESQASIVSEKSTVFTFPIEKPKFPNLTLP